MKKHIAAFLLAGSAVLTFPLRAQAQERTSPLAGAPAVRRRLEMRDKRFELGAGLGSTLGQDFYHAVLANVRAGYHVNSWLGVAATAGFNLTPDFKTSFHDRLVKTLGDTTTDRTPTRAVAEQAMNKVSQVYALQAEVVPFSGKYSLFGKLFMNYDFYAFGGLGFINFTAEKAACTADGPSCPVVGFKTGANFGVGMHSFINDYMAVDVEVRDIAVRNNPAGRDTNGDMKANGSDLSWDSNYMLMANVMFFFPRTVSKSD